MAAQYFMSQFSFLKDNIEMQQPVALDSTDDLGP